MARPNSPAQECKSPTSWPSVVTGVPGAGAGPVNATRQKPALNQPAVFRPRREFLAHIAALVPGDAGKLVEPSLQQQRRFRLQNRRAIRWDKGDAVCGVIGRAGVVGERLLAKQRYPASAERESGAVGGVSSGAPSQGINSVSGGHILQFQRGAQLVAAELGQ